MDSELYTSYKRYKADSDFVASWLANTAPKCGYVTTSVSDAPRASRLKGKERKLAQQNANAAGAANNTYRVKISEFVPLAECIARCRKPKIVVPSAFAYCLEQAIATRKRHQTFCQQLQQSSIKQDGHAHFIGVLERVQMILQKNTPAENRAQVRNSQVSSTGGSVANLFEHLKLEEAVEHTAQPGHTPQPSPSAKKFTVDSEADKSEALLAAVSLYHDLHSIRGVINELWIKYKKGQIDLVSVSLTTNTAIDLVRNLHEDFDKDFSGQVSLKDVPCFFCIKDTVLNNGRDSEERGQCLVSSYMMLEDILLDFKEATSDFIMSVEPRSMTIEPYEGLNATSTPEERLVCEYEIASEVIPEFCMLGKCSTAFQAEHNIIRGLRILTQEKRLPPWLPFALQIFLDVRRIFRGEIIQGFADLQRGAGDITRRIDMILDSGSIFSSGQSSMDGDIHQSLRKARELVDRWTCPDSDYVDNIRRDCQTDEAQSDEYAAYYLLNRDPLMCGLLLYRCQIRAHEAAIGTANSLSCIHSTAHLYNYLKQSDLIRCEWLDLEFLFCAQGCSNIFVGNKPPQTLQGCVKNFELSNGISLAKLKSNRPSQAISSKGKVKCLGTLVKTLWFFKHRYCDNSGRANITPYELEKLLRTKSKGGEPGERGNKITTISSLLEILADTLTDETMTLSFDYFELHVVCLRLLRRLDEAFALSLQHWHEFKGCGRFLPGAAFFVLWEALRRDVQGMNSGDVLSKAARIVSDTIAQEGDLVFAKSMPRLRAQFMHARNLESQPQS